MVLSGTGYSGFGLFKRILGLKDFSGFLYQDKVFISLIISNRKALTRNPGFIF